MSRPADILPGNDAYVKSSYIHFDMNIPRDAWERLQSLQRDCGFEFLYEYITYVPDHIDILKASNRVRQRGYMSPGNKEDIAYLQKEGYKTLGRKFPELYKGLCGDTDPEDIGG